MSTILESRPIIRLEGIPFEAVVASRLRELEIPFTWMNEFYESNAPHDFLVGDSKEHLDAKGSFLWPVDDDARGSGSMSFHDLRKDVDRGVTVWYVVNDLTVISAAEVKHGWETDDYYHVCEKRTTNWWGVTFTGIRTLEEWVETLAC